MLTIKQTQFIRDTFFSHGSSPFCFVTSYTTALSPAVLYVKSALIKHSAPSKVGKLKIFRRHVWLVRSGSIPPNTDGNPAHAEIYTCWQPSRAVSGSSRPVSLLHPNTLRFTFTPPHPPPILLALHIAVIPYRRGAII